MTGTLIVAMAAASFLPDGMARASMPGALSFDGRRIEASAGSFAAGAPEIRDSGRIPAGPARERSEAEGTAARMDEAIRSGIEFCGVRGFKKTGEDLKNLLRGGTDLEKMQFLNAGIQAYRLPARLDAERRPIRVADGGLCSGGCAEWASREVCVNQQVCELVCTVAGGAIGGGAGAGAGYVCYKSCQYVPKCSTVDTCVRRAPSGCSGARF